MLKLVAAEMPEHRIAAAAAALDSELLNLEPVAFWEQILTLLQNHERGSDKIQEMLHSPLKSENKQTALVWLHEVEQHGFREVVLLHTQRAEMVLQVAQPVVLKLSEASPSLRWELDCLSWLADHATNPADANIPPFPRPVSLDNESDEALRVFANYNGDTRVIATWPRFARVAGKYSRRLLQDAWACFCRAHAVGLVHCGVRRPNVMWDSASGKPVFIDWGYARFHSAEQYVDEAIREGYRERLARMKAEGSGAGTRMALATASRAVLTAAGSTRHVPLDLAMYPADDAVALIKLGIQMLELARDVLQRAPTSGFKGIDLWNVMLNSDQYHEVGNIVAQIELHRESISCDDLTALVHDAIDKLYLN